MDGALLFTVTSFHGQIVSSRIVPFYSQIVPQFQCKSRCEAHFFWPLALKNEGYTVTPLFLLVALRLLKSSDCIVKQSDNIKCNDLTMEGTELLILQCKWREQ